MPLDNKALPCFYLFCIRQQAAILASMRVYKPQNSIMHVLSCFQMLAFPCDGQEKKRFKQHNPAVRHVMVSRICHKPKSPVSRQVEESAFLLHILYVPSSDLYQETGYNVVIYISPSKIDHDLHCSMLFNPCK